LDTNLKKQKNDSNKSAEVASSLVSVDLTADACMDTFWNESKRPAPSFLKLKSKATMQHSQAAQAHLQEHAIRLSLQHNSSKTKQLSTNRSDIKAFATAPLKSKISATTDQFYGTVWEGLPPLPQGANVFNSSSPRQPEYFKVAKNHQDTFDKLAEVGGHIAKPIKDGIVAKKSEIQAKRSAVKADLESKKASLQQSDPLIANLLASFPAHLRPAVVDLSKAIACLSPTELDNLVDTADWRTRKLIRMVAAAKMRY
jgi:hypothetical protein